MFLPITVGLSLLQGQNAAVVPVPRQDGWWMKRHEAMVSYCASAHPELLFIGDSITHAFGGNPDTGESFDNRGKDTWDWFYGDRNAINLGISGDQTQHVLWRLDHGEMDGAHARLAVIMIGTNNVGPNTPAEIAEGVEAVCMKVREKSETAKELLLAIFPRDTPDSPNRAKVVATNALLEPWAKAHDITFLDIGKVFLDSKGVISPDIMPDRLHPFAFGYRKWAMAIEPTLSKLFGDKTKTRDDPNITTLVPVTQNRDFPSYDWMPRHLEVLDQIARSQDKPFDNVLIGDSITHHWGGPNCGSNVDAGEANWQAFWAPRNTLNEGFGWDRIENVRWRIQNGELDKVHPKNVLILIGTNNLQTNTPSEIATGISALLRAVKAKVPYAKILLLNILPRGEEANDPLRLKAQVTNGLIEALQMPRGVTYVKLWNPLLNPDGSISKDMMFDFLHPTAKGYGVISEVLKPFLAS